MSTVDLELRGRLVAYLEGNLPIADLHRWLVSEAWNIQAQADAETTERIHALELLLAEHAHGDWTADELRARILPFVTTYVLRSVEAQGTTAARTVSQQVILGAVPVPAPA